MTQRRDRRGWPSRGLHRLALAALAVATAAVPTIAVAGAGATPAPSSAVAAAPAAPDLGPGTLVLDPSMSTADIQAKVDAVAAAQVSNEMGPERHAILFKPGTYGTADKPLNFQVGYYTEVAGLGQNPGDVVINGSVYVRNQCSATGNCIALNNFWRSLSNLTVNVTTPGFGCYSGQFWAVSQAAPLRRVHVKGQTTLMDYCTGPSFASGGFIADSRFDGVVINGSQQQFFTRNSSLGSWTNGVWNQVFSGTEGAPAECFPGVANGCGPYTTVDTTSVSREKPYLYVDASGAYRVFVPAAATDSRGVSWASGSTPGRSIGIGDFYVARPSDSAQAINRELARGRNLLLTPGVYHLDQTLKVKRADTVVLGLGLASLTPTNGQVAMSVADVPGVDIAGITFDAGPVSSPVLLRIGNQRAAGTPAASRAGWSSAADPTGLQDVFFRIGGPYVGKATVSLEVNSDHVVLDDIWAWRADHGNGVGWTSNTADTGLVVNGDHVTATGLFVEHYQKAEVIWNGEHGSVTFFQNELPYDPPSQAAWMSAPGHEGYPALLVGPGVKSFSGSGMGSYSFFNQGVDVFAANAFEVPMTPGVHLHDLLTIFLDPSTGKGGIRNVVNGVGGSSTTANPDVPVTVVDYP
ncbi:discoidin domain-containing protein [Terrabacter aerolatus]|uniref:Coagulation factor 5/8 type n=1 Tax=Terrabacter aerolatus TaxID=422442 RepID=A0A512CWB2_9MICO|nr:glycosyl hydrolase family 28-related protein [Terrabacter aerolatus]GEO28290.1 coagulation factor 5/8 type [Terrabacter aerolatus]